MKQTEVSRATIGRIPLYLRYLKNKPHTAKNISATTLARELGLGEVQVRKDLGIREIFKAEGDAPAAGKKGMDDLKRLFGDL